MNEITKSTRVETALRVIQRMNEGLTVKSACLEVGMPRSTFYNILARDHEAIAIFQDMVVANEREKLWMILVSQTEILRKVIDSGLADSTKPKDRLAILKTLDSMREKLAQQLQVNNIDDNFIKDLFSGPVLIPGKSRYTSGSTNFEE
jgi:hypothetical protein